MSRVFFQDYLFENIKVDDNDFPLIDIEYCDNSETSISSTDSFSFKLSELMKMNSEIEWNDILTSFSKKSVVYIHDDIPIVNQELVAYKEFYLKTYCYLFSERCQKCYVIR